MGRRIGLGCLGATLLFAACRGANPGTLYRFVNECGTPIVVETRPQSSPKRLDPGEWSLSNTNDRETDRKLWVVRRQDGSGTEVQFRLTEPRGPGPEVYFRIEGERCPAEEPAG